MNVFFQYLVIHMHRMGKVEGRAVPSWSSADPALPHCEHPPEAEQGPPSTLLWHSFMAHSLTHLLIPVSSFQAVEEHLRLSSDSQCLIAFTNHAEIKGIKIASRVWVSSRLDAGSEYGGLMGSLMPPEIIVLIK